MGIVTCAASATVILGTSPRLVELRFIVGHCIAATKGDAQLGVRVGAVQGQPLGNSGLSGRELGRVTRMAVGTPVVRRRVVRAPTGLGRVWPVAILTMRGRIRVVIIFGPVSGGSGAGGPGAGLAAGPANGPGPVLSTTPVSTRKGDYPTATCCAHKACVHMLITCIQITAAAAVVTGPRDVRSPSDK